MSAETANFNIGVIDGLVLALVLINEGSWWAVIAIHVGFAVLAVIADNILPRNS